MQTYAKLTDFLIVIGATLKIQNIQIHSCNVNIHNNSRGLPCVHDVISESKSRENSKNKIEIAAKPSSITWAPYNWHGCFGMVDDKEKQQQQPSLYIPLNALQLMVADASFHRHFMYEWISHAATRRRREKTTKYRVQLHWESGTNFSYRCAADTFFRYWFTSLLHYTPHGKIWIECTRCRPTTSSHSIFNYEIFVVVFCLTFHHIWILHARKSSSSNKSVCILRQQNLKSLLNFLFDSVIVKSHRLLCAFIKCIFAPPFIGIEIRGVVDLCLLVSFIVIAQRNRRKNIFRFQ